MVSSALADSAAAFDFDFFLPPFLFVDKTVRPGMLDLDEVAVVAAAVAVVLAAVLVAVVLVAVVLVVVLVLTAVEVVAAAAPVAPAGLAAALAFGNGGLIAPPAMAVDQACSC